MQVIKQRNCSILQIIFRKKQKQEGFSREGPLIVEKAWLAITVAIIGMNHLHLSSLVVKTKKALFHSHLVAPERN